MSCLSLTSVWPKLDCIWHSFPGKRESLTHGQKANYTYLILCTVAGVAAGLQNTG